MIPLEDNFSDVIAKAQRGLEISDSDLAEKARLDANAIRKLRGGHFDELALFRVAPVLGLGARALSDLAQNEYRPAAREMEGFNALSKRMFGTPQDEVAEERWLWEQGPRAPGLLEHLVRHGERHAVRNLARAGDVGEMERVALR